MADRRSALAHLPQIFVENAAVSLTESRFDSILQVAAWPDTLRTVQAVIAEFLGVEAPPTGRAATGKNIIVAAVAPGRFLLAGVADDLAPRLEAALPSADAAVSDLSHGRVVLRLEGEAATALLAKGVALDLDLTAFPPGRIAQAAIHHVDVLVHRLGETTFELWVLRGFAEALAEWLIDAGGELSIRFHS